MRFSLFAPAGISKHVQRNGTIVTSKSHLHVSESRSGAQETVGLHLRVAPGSARVPPSTDICSQRDRATETAAHEREALARNTRTHKRVASAAPFQKMCGKRMRREEREERRRGGRRRRRGGRSTASQKQEGDWLCK